MVNRPSVAPDVTHISVAGSYLPLVQELNFACQCFAKRVHAEHRGVLVVSFPHVAFDRVNQLRRAVEVRKSLAEIDRAHVLREPRHHGKDRDPSSGQLRLHALRVRHIGYLSHSSIHSQSFRDSNG